MAPNKAHISKACHVYDSQSVQQVSAFFAEEVINSGNEAGEREGCETPKEIANKTYPYDQELCVSTTSIVREESLVIVTEKKERIIVFFAES